jgi:hypothetical protein
MGEVQELRGVRLFLDGMFKPALSPRNLYLALYCIPELLGMHRIADSVITPGGHVLQGIVIIAESHVAIAQTPEHGFIDISTCAPEKLNDSVVIQYVEDILHFQTAKVWKQRWET